MKLQRRLTLGVPFRKAKLMMHFDFDFGFD